MECVRKLISKVVPTNSTALFPRRDRDGQGRRGIGRSRPGGPPGQRLARPGATAGPGRSGGRRHGRRTGQSNCAGAAHHYAAGGQRKPLGPAFPPWPLAERCAATVAAGRIIRVDAGSASGRVFLLMAGCGLDGETFAACMAAGRDRSAARVMSNQSSIRCVITDIPNFGYIGTTIGLGLPAQSPQVFARWLFAINLPCYGARLQIAPEPTGQMGSWTFAPFRRGNLWHDLYYLGAMFLGIHQ